MTRPASPTQSWRSTPRRAASTSSPARPSCSPTSSSSASPPPSPRYSPTRTPTSPRPPHPSSPTPTTPPTSRGPVPRRRPHQRQRARPPRPQPLPDPDKAEAVHHSLAVLENLINLRPHLADLVCDRTKVLRWLLAACTGILPCSILIPGLFFIPESPRWLEKMGKMEDFESSLQVLRGFETDISAEVNEIKRSVQSSRRTTIQFADIKQKRYSVPLMISIGLLVLQQLSGVNGIFFYAASIFIAAGIENFNLATCGLGAVQVVATGVTTWLTDKAGRWLLLIISTTGMTITLLIVSVSFFVKAFVIAFSLGLGAIPWIIISEGGTVTAMTINYGVLLGFVPSDDAEVVLQSGQFEGVMRFRVDDLQKPIENPGNINWESSARGAVYALQNSGYKLRKGIIGYISGVKGLDSSGLSSSAAVS